MLEMSSVVQAGQPITFTVRNFMRDDMMLDYAFQSDDFRFDEGGNGRVRAGTKKTFAVGVVSRTYEGSENFNLRADAVNARTGEKMQSRRMNDFYLERG